MAKWSDGDVTTHLMSSTTDRVRILLGASEDVASNFGLGTANQHNALIDLTIRPVIKYRTSGVQV